MKVYCSQGLIEKLNMMPQSLRFESKANTWHAHILQKDQQTVLVFVHALTNYAIFFRGLKSQQWEHLSELLIEGIGCMWQAEGIKASAVKRYIAQLGSMVPAKERSKLFEEHEPHLSKELSSLLADTEEDGFIQIEASKICNRIAVPNHGNFNSPRQALVKFMNDFCVEDSLEDESVIMKISMYSDNLIVWRRLQIPLHYTFKELHMAIQSAFGWRDKHLHCFYLYGDMAKQDQSLANHPGYHPDGIAATRCLQNRKEVLMVEDPHVVQELENGCFLKDLMTDKMLYVYDYNDRWEHMIEIEQVIRVSDRNEVVELDGGGSVPPESMSWKGSMAYFLEAITVPHHPQREEFLCKCRGEVYHRYDLHLEENHIVAGML